MTSPLLSDQIARHPAVVVTPGEQFVHAEKVELDRDFPASMAGLGSTVVSGA
jgi:hypothetical protein